MWIPEWMLWAIAAIAVWIWLVPSIGRNMDGDTLLTWMGTRWIKHNGKWSKTGNGWK